MNYRKKKGLALRLFTFCLGIVPCFILWTTAAIRHPFETSSQTTAPPVIGDEVITTLNQYSEVSVAVALYPTRVSLSIHDIEKYNLEISDLQQSVLDELDPSGYSLIHHFKSVPGFALRIKSTHVLYHLASLPEVRRIDLDVGGEGGLNDSRPLINADQAHSQGFTGLDRIVAVLDSGIDSDHPDLAGALVDEHCFSYTPSNGGCPDGSSEQAGPGSAEDDHGHGTKVIGIITGDGITAPLGIAPDTKIVAVKVLDSNNEFYDSSTIVAALDWILNNRPDVNAVNMSLYTYETFSDVCDDQYAWTMNLASAINNLRDIGILCVAIAGNDQLIGQISAPGCISSCMAIGATTKNDSATSFSNSSESVDLFAPGQGIISTAMGGGIGSITGTSAAAPHVTAAAAILKQKKSNLLPSDLESALKTSPVYITDSAGLIRPRLDVIAALDAVEPAITISGKVLLDGGTTKNIMAVRGGLSGVVMKGLSGSPVTDDLGNYSAKVKFGWTGIVTPAKTGYTFTPLSINYSNVTSDQANQDYVASFDQVTLTISALTGGTTDPSPGYHTYDYGTEVKIRAIVDSGYKFNGWSGDASGTSNPITITMDEDKSVIATFSKIPKDGGDEDGKEGGCFIATATYGSQLHSNVHILRDFRDKYLVSNKLGRVFVELYNKYSPPIAHLIAKHKSLKVFVRINLVPLIIISYAMLHLDPAATLAIFFFIVVIPVIAILYFQRRQSRLFLIIKGR